MPTEAPPTAEGSDDGQWDVVRTIHELESLQANTHRVIQHTLQKMGHHHGYAPDGSEIIEHPLGACMAMLGEALKACHAKYGRDMLNDARVMDATITFKGDQ